MSEEEISLGGYIALVCCLLISTSLSLAGSAGVVRIAYMKLSSTYQRFLCLLSVAHIYNSSFLLLHPFMVPNGTPGYAWAIGNDATCKTFGFFFISGSLLVALYNACLSTYFLFSIQSSPKMQKDPEDIIGLPERLAHLACWLVPLGVAGASTGMGAIGFHDDFGLCVYDAQEGTMSLVFESIVIFAVFIGIATTVMIFFKVQSTIKMGKEPGYDADSISEDTIQRLRAVSSQSILYTCIFVTSYICPALMMTLSFSSDSFRFIIQLLAYIFYPIQGVWVCAIYLRPRYSMLRMMYPSDSAFVVFRMAASKAGDPEEIENVRAIIYGSDYESPSECSSEQSFDSDLPMEIEFDPDRPISVTSMVSAPEDRDDAPAEEPEKVETEVEPEDSEC